MDRDWLEQIARRYAARWETSESNMGSHLAAKIQARCDETGADPDATIKLIPGIIEGLVESGYVDDRRFAEATINRLRRQGRSAAQIDARLRAKGISKSLRQDLADRDEEIDHESIAAWKLAQRRRLGPYCDPPEKRAKDRDKHVGVLARQGFDLELSMRVIDADTPPLEFR